MCRAIEIDLRESLCDAALPSPMRPVNFCLT